MRSRRCAGCGHRVSARARFCEQCGAALTPGARPLRAPSTLEAKILRERSGIEGEHKQVTVLYTDIVGSTELTRSLGAERWGVVLAHFLAIAADAVHGLEGTVNQFTGDGLMAVFGAPLAHEDHARRACLAALALQREVAGLAAEVARRDGVEFAVRCGLNSGDVIVGLIGDDVHMDFVPLGTTTALGKRIEDLAPVRSTAISASTAALIEGEFEVRELGDFEVKGIPGHQRVLELVGPGAAQTRLAAVAATRGLSRFVGRAAERAVLESALERALGGEGRAIGIVGDPGVGKSRLVREFVTGCVARGLPVNAAGCVAHGRDIPFLPLLALYLDWFGVGDRDGPELARQRIESTLLALDPAFTADLPLLFDLFGVADPMQAPALFDPEARRRRLLAVVSRTIMARSRHEAAVLVVEDLHWIDDASAALLDELVRAVVGTGVLLVCTYRPEHDATWTSDSPHAELRLDPLDADAADDLLTELLGHHHSVQRLAARIKARSAGNPFFIEEIVQGLAEGGDLIGARGDFRVASDIERVILPATVQAGLAARIDRLPAREKTLVHTMSVIGTDIPEPLLREVCELGERELSDAVAKLTDAQLVIPGESADGYPYTFKHPLTQEVAYATQLSERRARAHRTVAAAIERTYPDRLDERAALLAHHYDACGDTRQSARWHARAAACAEHTFPAEGMRHWRRVRALAGDLDAGPERDDLASKARIGILGLAWRLGSSPDETAAIYAEGGLSQAGVPAGNDLEGIRLDFNYAATLMHSGRERDGLELFRHARADAIAAGDSGRALTAGMGVAYASWLTGMLTEGVDAIDHALALTGGNPTEGAGLAFRCPGAFALQHRGLCLGYMGELERARQDFDRALELARDHDDPEIETYRHVNLARLEADVGAFESALHVAALGLDLAEQAGNTVAIVATSTTRAVAEAGTGRFADALAQAGANLATIRRVDVSRYLEPVLLATMARCKLALGESNSALADAQQAVATMDARGLATCALAAPITLAQVLIATQGVAAAERIETVLDRAQRIASKSGARVFEPGIHRQRAEVARLRGDDQAAQREQTEAERLDALMPSGRLQ